MTNIVTGIVCVFIGIVLYRGKTANMIAGYNTMPKEQKEKYDPDKLSRFSGRQCIISGAVMLLSGVLMIWIPFKWMETVAWGIFTAVVLGGVIYGSKTNMFVKEEYK